MRNPLFALIGFLVGAGAMVAIALAASHTTAGIPAQASPTVAPAAVRTGNASATTGSMTNPSATSNGSGMNASATPGGPMMNGSATGGSMIDGASAPAGGPQTLDLSIRHVLRGCHVWSDGKMTAPALRLHLKVGERLSVLDQDVDAHQLLEFAGPAHLAIGGPMMMGTGRTTVSFTKPGLYQLGTKTVDMPGGGMDLKTIGPDNKLRLTVTVA